MRRDSFEILMSVFVLAMLMPALALANHHWGYVYWDEQDQDYLPFDVDVSDREVAPGGYITVEFGYTVLVSDGAPTSLWAIVFDGENGQVPYNKPPSVLLAEGGPSTQPDGTYTFDFTGENAIVVQIPGTAIPGQYPINIFSCAASYRPVADFKWYQEDYPDPPPGAGPILVTVGNEAPEITCPDDFTVYVDPGETEAVVEFEVTATDNVSEADRIEIVCDPASGSTFPLGDTVVTCTATDEAGNEATCTFTITVVESVEPPGQTPQEIVQDIIDYIVEDMYVPAKAEKDMGKAVKELEKAIKEFDKGKVDKAIKKIEKAIKQLKKAEKKGADTQAVVDVLVDLIEEL